MASEKRKKKTAHHPQDADRSPSFRISRGRVLVALGVIALLGWLSHAVWQQVGPRVIQQQEYLLAADRISTTPIPEWIEGNFVGDVVRDAGLDGRLSLLDDAFAEVVENAFVLHPWVESVARIEKRHPRGVYVELVFRKPVAVVEMPASEGVVFVPVDSAGVHLPTKDVADMKKRYLPRIGGIVGRPPVGQQWPDARVIGAALLAEQLQDVWEDLHLVDILPSARPEIRGDHRYFVYELVTRGGTRVVWGAAPDASPPGEHEFAAKLSRLKQCVAEHGPLNSVRSPAVVDVRQKLAITPRTVKKPASPEEDSSMVKRPSKTERR